ncbi:hypothetical protein HID58_048761 [Brassica napus]|uniref:non-specific serine/threonine protein kinase n=1 Tax=Brassica napus TaxID=3708 RepID=A0ABQ8B379_BRANA|nr:hypothetical protein HID58_048761 [Brassica napus]
MDAKKNLSPICRLSHPTNPHTLSSRTIEDQPKKLFTWRDDFYFCCTTCDVEFHMNCYMQPKKLIHPYHLQHPLVFIDKNNKTQTDKCSWCGSNITSFYYRCPICSFCLDISCSSNFPSLTISDPKSHHHSLSLFPRPLLVPCDACGLINQSDPSYVCFQCSYIVHESCINLPRVIKITRHQHRLSYTPFLSHAIWSYAGYATRLLKTSMLSIHATMKVVLIHHQAGIVYKGAMPNGDQVAVKRLAAMSRGSSHDHGFNAEIQTLGRIRHRHIVRLLGFCSNHETNLLVYEYMPNGSLGEVLHGKKGGHLHWDTRYKIALEASKGLCYLHHDCSPLIVHRDVKSNNILLDSNFEAHVADFGLAKFLQDSGTCECMSAIAGSYGYIAPEYAYTLKIEVNDHGNMPITERTALIEVRYKHDEHPLTLCYGETVDAKYWCEIREKELDSTKWFYTCNTCCVTIHLDCMFGFFVRMKPGFTFGYNGLMVRVLGNTSSTRPICDGCEQRCPAHVYYKVYWRRYKLASCSLDCLNQVLKGRICKQKLFP